MREYLLGTLDADLRSALEDRISCEPQVYEELLAVEKELIDQYVAGGLSKLERHQFETHFLPTAERQKNLRFGQLLHERLNIEKTASGRNLSHFVRKVPTLALSGALVVCLGIIFFGWIIAQKSAEGLVRQSAPGSVVVTLSPSSTRAAGTTQLLTLPPRGADVKVELELTSRSFHVYKSELFKESETVDTRDGLRMEAKGDHHVLPLVIAGGILTPGEYRVRLSGVLDSGEERFVDDYFFRVAAR